MKYEVLQLDGNEYLFEFIPEDIKEKNQLQTLSFNFYRNEDQLVFLVNKAIEEMLNDEYAIDEIQGQDLDAQFFAVVATLRLFPEVAG